MNSTATEKDREHSTLWKVDDVSASWHAVVQMIYDKLEELGLDSACFTRRDLKFYQRYPHKIPMEWDGLRIYALGSKPRHMYEEPHFYCLNCVRLKEQRESNFESRPQIDLHTGDMPWQASKDRIVYFTRLRHPKNWTHRIKKFLSFFLFRKKRGYVIPYSGKTLS